jgi:hypothetical protein
MRKVLGVKIFLFFIEYLAWLYSTHNILLLLNETNIPPTDTILANSGNIGKILGEGKK